jgi:hypothetical protein
MAKIPREQNNPQPDSAAKTQAKYKTFEEFRRGVRAVRGVTDGGRLVLGVFADYANYRTAMTRPGDKRLIAETGRTDRGVQFIRRQLQLDRLIELIEGGKAGAGRGNAAVYRICVEDDRFPVPDPTNKTRSKTAGFSTEETRSDTSGFNPNANPTVNQTIPEVATEKTRSTDRENPKSELYPFLRPTINTSISDTPPPANNAGGCVSLSPEQTKAATFLLRFRNHFHYDLIEADARLGWINHRYLHRTDGSDPVPVKSHWLYVLKANENLNEQYNEAAKQAILERQRYTDQWRIPVRTCSGCHDLVIVGMNCDCGLDSLG